MLSEYWSGPRTKLFGVEEIGIQGYLGIPSISLFS